MVGWLDIEIHDTNIIDSDSFSFWFSFLISSGLCCDEFVFIPDLDLSEE